MRLFIIVSIVSCLTFAYRVGLQAQPKQWMFVRGDSLDTIKALYGTKGVADYSNYPGIRSGSFTWTDQPGDFWLFGGNGSFSTRVDGMKE